MTNRKSRLSDISIFVSIFSIAATILINGKIAIAYNESHGKTRALFGLIEIQFAYQYYLVILGIIAIALAIFGSKGNAQKAKVLFAILLGLFSIAVVFMRIWRLFI